MKKQIAILATIIGASGFSAFGQGYFNYTTSGSAPVYDEFTTVGTGVKAANDVKVTFLWNASTTAADPLGAGQATTGVSTSTGSWATIATMLSDGWNLATVNGTSTEADSGTTASGPSTGAINYGTFQVANASTAGPYEVVVIAWAAADGSSESAAASNGSTLGWSSAFDYTASTSSTTSPGSFSTQGMSAFGVADVPEPTTLALAGLGGLSMLFLRRRSA